MKLKWLLGLVTMVSALAAAAPDDPVSRVRAWREQHEKQILLELFDFLKLPNVATNKGDIERNAQALTRLLELRRFLPDRIATSASPVIIAEHEPAGRTITLSSWNDKIDPEWRIYGRSSSDDKSPIIAFLAAIDGLESANIPLTSNVRVVLEGDEEAGS